MAQPDTSFLVNGFKPTVAAADPRDVMAFRQQQAAGAQQLQEGALDLQAKQRTMAEGQKLRDLFAQPGMTVDNAIPQVMAINPTTGMALAKSNYEMNKAKLDNQDKQIEIAGKTLDHMGSIAGSIHDDASLHQGLATAIGHQWIDPQVAQGMLASGYTPEVQAQLDGMIAQSKSTKDQHAEALATLADKRAQLESGYKSQAAPFQQAKAEGEAASAKVDPATGLNPNQTREAKTASDQIAATQARDLQVQKDEDARRVLEGKRVGIEGQKAGIEAQRNFREQQIYNNTYGAGANEALVGVEPKLRTAATAAAQKAGDEYNKAAAAQRDMETFVSLARAGNKEAYAYLSPEGVLTLNTARGVIRVNRQEIDAYGGAGSLYDRIAGAIGKAGSGRSISSGVIDDIEKLHQAVGANADTAYNSKLDALNQNYHANFKRVPMAKAATAAGGVQAAQGGYEVGKKYNGKTYNGGDPNDGANWK